MGRPRKDAITAAMDTAVVIDDEVVRDGEVQITHSYPQPDLSPTDPGWNDFVMGQFEPNELDPTGNPFTAAIGRVAEKLLGPIVAVIPQTKQVPDASNGYRATVEVLVTFAWGSDRTDLRTFGDVADCYAGNTPAKYAVHPSSTAKTKAEGRAYRNALKLRKVYTSEELAETPPVEEAGLNGMIALSQQRFIDKLCKEMDIDAFSFINSGKKRYQDVNAVSYESAGAMIDKLNGYQQNISSIPENIRGYNPNWRKRD